MKYSPDIQKSQNEPAHLENLYQTARQAGEEAEFRADLSNLYQQSPDNLLYAAWYYRLQALPEAKARRAINWLLAIILGIITGLLFGMLFDQQNQPLVFLDTLPYLFLLGAPIATLLAMIFLTVTPRQHYRRAALVGLGLAALCGYVLIIVPGQKPAYYMHSLDLAAIHLILLSWAALGLTVLGFKSSANNRFAFLIKSLEVGITAGLYLIAGVAFGGISMGLFAALNVTLPDVVIRLAAAGGLGLLPVLAVASVYDPHTGPVEQDFSQGLSRFIATMMRLLLPLTLLVLVIYIGFIPFNFMAPFLARDVLIVYNLMLFAIMGLLVGVTPLTTGDLSPRLQTALRRGILAVAILAILVSVYALSAVVYRTVLGGITLNRTAIIGWNSINIGILIALVYTQLRHGTDQWAARLQAVFGKAATIYLIWALILVIAVPLVFR